MGLTLHYQFTAANRTPTEVRALIDCLRTHAQSLDFESVSQIIEIKGDACLFDPEDQGDPHAWLKVQTIRFEIDAERDVIAPTGEIHPVHIIAFTVKPEKDRSTPTLACADIPIGRPTGLGHPSARRSTQVILWQGTWPTS